jgi:hydroxymethylglutaryl-CoA lyase
MNYQSQGIKIVECPRDAIQGLHKFISTEDKVRYINSLLKVGFDTLDFGSFVCQKTIPQMRDTASVLQNLDIDGSKTRLLAIVANKRGAEDAVKFEEIHYLGYPFSISETFQMRNTNATINESLERVKAIHEICIKNKKELVLYISMGFGNPYGDPWSAEIVLEWVNRLSSLGISIFQLSDTVGVAEPESINYLFSTLISANPTLEIGAHFHTSATTWKEKVEAAYNNGCRKFDGTIWGFGGCPMAADELIGNMPSENLIEFAHERNISTGLNLEYYLEAMKIAGQILN